MEPTLDALLVMESQFHEGGANGYAGLVSGRTRPEGSGAAEEVRQQSRRDAIAGMPTRYRNALVDSTARSAGEKSNTRRPSRSASMAGARQRKN